MRAEDSRFHIPDDGTPGTRRLLRALAEHAPEEGWLLGDLLMHVRQRAFGMLVLIATLPAFLPLPVGGGLFGPLVMLLGLQMMLGREVPWLPQWMARHAVPVERLRRFVRRTDRLLEVIERGCRPRWTHLSRGPGLVFNGLMLTWMGFLLALPIPFTNYPFGLVLVLYAVALTERDGRLLVLVWTVILAITLAFAGLGGTLWQWLQGWW
jgi:hypothetical protein